METQPAGVALGFNSKPRSVQLPEPSREEVLRFAESLTRAGITVREKDLRRDDPPGSESPPVVPIPDCLPAAEQHLRTHDPELALLTDRELIQQLCQTDGIGRWTAEMFLIFSLGRPNVFPAADHGVVKTIKRHYSLPETAQTGEIRQIARRWPVASRGRHVSLSVWGKDARLGRSWAFWRATRAVTIGAVDLPVGAGSSLAEYPPVSGSFHDLQGSYQTANTGRAVMEKGGKIR